MKTKGSAKEERVRVTVNVDVDAGPGTRGERRLASSHMRRGQPHPRPECSTTLESQVEESVEQNVDENKSTRLDSTTIKCSRRVKMGLKSIGE